MEKEQHIDSTDSTEKPSIFWQDEVLQVMYWMRGEGFGTKLTTVNLQRFLQASDDVLQVNLSQLAKNGLVNLNVDGKYELTEAGVKEGGRRFADEFEGMLKQGHYECNDPDCDCHNPEFAGEACKHLSSPHIH